MLSTNGSPHQTYLITSPEIGEGKSLVVANLAIALAQSGKSVLAVDCDLRRPSLHTLFKLPNELGLSDVLTRFIEVDEGLQNSKTEGLQVITSGSKVTNPSQLLGSEIMSSTVDKLKQRADYVLFDTPSLRAVSDAALVNPLVDGVVLVISRGITREKGLINVQNHLEDIHANVIGVVINRAEKGLSYAYYQE